MNKATALLIGIVFFTACRGGASQQQAQNTGGAANQPQKPADSLVVSSHSSTPMPAIAPQKTAGAPQNQTESPMAKAVNVSEMTANIEKADKEYKAKPADAKAKETLAKAYFTRAFVLTENAQYRAALGDFRKGLKLKPDDADAKAMHDRIIGIFQSLNREPPKEGEEPPPLPFQKKES